MSAQNFRPFTSTRIINGAAVTITVMAVNGPTAARLLNEAFARRVKVAA